MKFDKDKLESEALFGPNIVAERLRLSSNVLSSSDTHPHEQPLPSQFQLYSLLNFDSLPLNLIHLVRVESTQNWCMKNIKILVDEFGLSPYTWVCVSAKYQTKGIGQIRMIDGQAAQMKWVDSKGSVKVSFAITWPKRKLETLTLLPIVVAAAVARTIETLGTPRCEIKWVNDILINQKKVAGVLVTNAGHEILSDDQEPFVVIIVGIGINVMSSPNRCNHAFTDPHNDVEATYNDIKNLYEKKNILSLDRTNDDGNINKAINEATSEGLQRATSIADELELASEPPQFCLSPQAVLEVLTSVFYHSICQFEQRGFKPFLQYVNPRLYKRNQSISLTFEGPRNKQLNHQVEIVTGKFLGLNAETGHLQLLNSVTGEPQEFCHGRMKFE